MLPFTINHRHKAHTASSPPHPHHQPIHVCAALHLVWLVVVLLLSPSIRWLHLPLPCRLMRPGCVSPQHTQAVQHRTIQAEHCMHNTHCKRNVAETVIKRAGRRVIHLSLKARGPPLDSRRTAQSEAPQGMAKQTYTCSSTCITAAAHVNSMALQRKRYGGPLFVIQATGAGQCLLIDTSHFRASTT